MPSMQALWLRTRLRVSLLALVLVACSGPPKPAEPERLWNTADEKAENPESESGPKVPEKALSLADACERLQRLRNDGCEWAERFPANFADGDLCEESLATWVDPATPNHVSLERSIRCWSLDCDAAIPCLTSARELRVPDKARSCGDEGSTAIIVDDDTWQARRGLRAKRFADVSTTVEEPVEVCKIDGEIDWMTGVTCDDGSNPYASREEVNEGRDSWLDRGGRCNSILDRYTVSCPEATYTIHIDRYLCPASP